MTSGKKSIVYSLLGSFLLVPPARCLVSDSPANPYRAIPERNIFALKPQISVSVTPEVKQPASKITLCGIITIGGKRVLLKAQIPPRPPAEPAREESYILAEGQSEGGIEIVSIDENAGKVKINNHGLPQTLDFENNGAKLPAASALPPLAVPTMPPIPAAAGMVPIPQRPAGAGAGGGFTGSRNYQPGGQPQGNGGYQPGQPYQGGGVPGNQAVLGFNNTGGPSDAAHGGAPVDFGLTGEQQSALIELERQRLKEKGDPESASMMPPTEFAQ